MRTVSQTSSPSIALQMHRPLWDTHLPTATHLQAISMTKIDLLCYDQKRSDGHATDHRYTIGRIVRNAGNGDNAKFVERWFVDTVANATPNNCSMFRLNSYAFLAAHLMQTKPQSTATSILTRKRAEVYHLDNEMSAILITSLARVSSSILELLRAWDEQSREAIFTQKLKTTFKHQEEKTPKPKNRLLAKHK